VLEKVRDDKELLSQPGVGEKKKYFNLFFFFFFFLGLEAIACARFSSMRVC